MPVVIGVKFKNSNKIYYFDPNGIEFHENEGVVVETVCGLEYAIVAIPNKEVSEKEIKKDLKQIVRKATHKDEIRVAENAKKKPEIMRIAKEIIKARNMQMKLVDCDYTLDGKKLMLYFTAGGRIDFRDLAKDLASHFKVRIELRQITERDEIKHKGVLAPCGRPCCCATFMTDFDKVSLKMAKIQGLSLSPTKVSGMCGKLMCCLRYENDFYVEQSKKIPAMNSEVTTPDGKGICCACNLLRGTVSVKTENDGVINVTEYPVEQLKFQRKKDTGKHQKTDIDEDTDELPDTDE